jgi:PIN domain nuclease of toxin-antitoxin system
MLKLNDCSMAMTMRILLDTCIAYDWMMGKIADQTTIRLIETTGAYVSAVSILEMSIKHGLGKLPLPSRNPAKDIEEQGFAWLNVTPYHAERVLDSTLITKTPSTGLSSPKPSMSRCGYLPTTRYFRNTRAM